MTALRPLTGDDVEALFRQGLALRAEHRFAEAEPLYRLAVELASGSAAAHHNLGGIYTVLGRLDEAELCCRRALELAPDLPVVRHALATVLLSQGRYGEGFPLYAARHDLPALANPRPDIAIPEWRGEDLAGRRILILGEQGFGDRIQFARFVPMLRARGAEVAFDCAPPLERLFRESLDVRPGRPDAADLWIKSSSLAWRLGLTPETLPNAPYLTAVPRHSGQRIGLVTRGNPNHPNDAHRSLDPASARRLAATGALDLSPEATRARDFAETAEIVAGLDLVISVDTSVAHLAGAMGKPVWTLLPAANTDWRWMTGRTDSPWYPSMRLFRQPRIGDWTPVIDEVLAALAREVPAAVG